YSSNVLDSLIISKEKLYEHKTLWINFTTYDLHQEHDTINPNSHPNIMLLSQDELTNKNAHPYWYARVTFIFHVMVCFHHEDPSKSHHLDVLLIQWLHQDSNFQDIFAHRCLSRVSFFPLGTSECWDFIDPSTVIRLVHLLPGFESDCVPGPSIPHNISRMHFGSKANESVY
ncbi:hypothetical protein CONPUDRAFT_58968, partial [Coniophora puteana RWD-64-598 SS2]